MHSLGNKVFRIKGFQVDPARRMVEHEGQSLNLRPKTFDLLLYLIQHRDRMVTKDELLSSIWGDTAVTDNSLVQCVVELRRTLADNPKSPTVLRTIPRLGYQFIASVEEMEFSTTHMLVEVEEETTTVELEYTEEDVTAVAPAPASLPAPRATWKLRMSIAAAFLAVCLALGWFWRDRDVAAFTLPEIAGKSRIAVLYFDNQSGDHDLDWMREGLADLLITNLSRSPKLTVLSRQQLHLWLRRVGRNTGDDIPLETALNLAGRVGAEVLVQGSFAQFGKSLRVNVQVHDREGRFLGSENATAGAPEQILNQMDLLSIKLASRWGAAPVPQRDASIPLTRNLEAYRCYSLGLEKAQAYHSEQAIELLERAVTLDPKFAMAHARIGYTYAVTGASADQGRPYLEKAFQLSEGLTERDRLFVAAWYSLANLDFPGAVKAFRSIVQRYPQETEAYARLGHLLRGEEQYEEAISVLKAGLAVDPEAQDVYNALGGIYSQLGRHEDAIAMLERYSSLAPNEANAYDSLGLAHDWAGRPEVAEHYFRRALEIQPGFTIAVIHMAELHYRGGKYEEALRECGQYLKAVQTEVEFARGSETEALIYLRRNELERAEQSARRALRRWSGSSNDILRRILIARGRVQDAVVLGPGVKPVFSHRGARPPSRNYVYQQGEYALLAKRPEEAIEQFKQALQHWPGWAEAERHDDCLADAYRRLSRTEEAIAEYERVIRTRPADARSHYAVALLYRQKGAGEQARAHLQRFLELWKDADRDLPEIIEARRLL